MFTGIIEELGAVETLVRHASGARLSVRCAQVLSDLAPGGSVSVNGVCLTAVEIRPDGFSADLAPETLERSNLGDLAPGLPVNLERPLSLQTRLGGHFVQGHVDGTGTLESLRELGDGNWELAVRIPASLERFLVYKGSVAIDGMSLTIASIETGLLRIAIIPHTYAVTNLAAHKPGDRLNVECDILAKYVERLLPSQH
jgi:riboflavin synthase